MKHLQYKLQNVEKGLVRYNHYQQQLMEAARTNSKSGKKQTEPVGTLTLAASASGTTKIVKNPRSMHHNQLHEDQTC